MRRILSLFGLAGSRKSSALRGLPVLERASASHVLRLDQGLPHVDWGAADAWISKQQPDTSKQASLRRALAAVWLDELRDALEVDHRRWRHALIEGLGPVDDGLAIRVSRAGDRSIEVITKALQPIRPRAQLPPVAIVALKRTDDYYTFISHYYPDEGQWGTSGGCYINEGSDSFPVIALPVQVRHSVELTIAHEMTHHALRGLDLPLWVEEGLTQMMEERVTGYTDFRLDREMIERQRGHWDEVALSRFWSGEAFSSSEEDEQELAYHLAQVLVRGLLTQRAADFFVFVRECGASGVEQAASEHLGGTLEDVADRFLSVPRGV